MGTIYAYKDSMFRYFKYSLFFLVQIHVGYVHGFGQAEWYCKSFYVKTRQQQHQLQQSSWNGRAPIMASLAPPYHPSLIPYSPLSSYAIKETRNLDQGSSKECFIFAFLGALESTKLNSKGESVHYYPEYVIAQKLKYTIQGLLEFQEGSTYYNLEGGEFFHAMNLTKETGLIPIGANWEPLMDVKKWPFNSIYSAIKQETDTIRNSVNLSGLSLEAKSAFIKENTEKIFTKVLGHYVGFLPDHFYYKGKYYTPVSFVKNNDNSEQGNVESVFYLKARGRVFSNTYTDNSFNYWKSNFKFNHKTEIFEEGLSTSDFLNRIDNEIRHGRAVVVDLDGETSLSIGHSMVIVDFEKRGPEFIAVKMKNSFVDNPNGNFTWYKINDLLSKARRVWTINL